RDGGEPGVGVNTGLSVDSTTSGEKNSNTSEKNQTEYLVIAPKTVAKMINNGGDPTATGVSVLFPRSRFVQEYKQIKNSDKEPDSVALQAFIDDQLRLKRAIVKGCVGTLADEAVTVADYPDSLPTTGGATLAAAAPMSLML